MGMSITPTDGTGTPTVMTLRRILWFIHLFLLALLHETKGAQFCYFQIIAYQYVISTWLFLLKLRMFSTTSALLASRRAPDASFSSLKQGSRLKSDLILFPVIILERTGSTELMDVTPVSSEKHQLQMFKFSRKVFQHISGGRNKVYLPIYCATILLRTYPSIYLMAQVVYINLLIIHTLRTSDRNSIRFVDDNHIVILVQHASVEVLGHHVGVDVLKLRTESFKIHNPPLLGR